MTDLDAKYMTRQEIYREACAPRADLSEHFVDSLRFRIIQDDPGYWDKELDNHVCLPQYVALRAAISEAWEGYTIAERTIEKAPHIEAAMRDTVVGEAFGRRHVAMRVIRDIARELYRHTVPHEERTM